MRCVGMPRNWKASLLVLLLMAGTSFGEEVPVPIDRQAMVLLKALSYDRNLEKRSGERVNIAVLYQEEEGAEAEAHELAEAFNKAGREGVKGLPVTAQVVAFKSVEELLKQVEAHGFNALYIHPSLISALSSVQQVTRSRKILSLSGTRKLVEQGLALGVYLDRGVPRLVMNARAGIVEGLALDPAVVLVATVIE